MNTKNFALWGGSVMLAMGVISLIPMVVGSSEILPPLNVEVSYGQFLNIFPMNIFNKVALIAFGLAGIYVSKDFQQSITFSRTVFYVMGALAILGIIPITNTLFGYLPLFGGETIGHAMFAGLGAYFGYPERVGVVRTV